MLPDALVDFDQLAVCISRAGAHHLANLAGGDHEGHLNLVIPHVLQLLCGGGHGMRGALEEGECDDGRRAR